MNPVVGLVFDIVIIIALGVTVFYCLRLSRQFNELQANRKAFEALIQSLNVASSRADTVIRSIKEAAVGGGEALQEKIGRARALCDEMEIIIQAGDSVANRLQGAAESARKTNPAAAGQPDVIDDSGEAEPRTRVEKELQEALKAKQQG